MANKPQQQTLSLPVSEGMRQRLERARQLVSSKTGEIVSTSEIAKRLLESAREERMEVVDLMADPTETLLRHHTQLVASQRRLRSFLGRMHSPAS